MSFASLTFLVFLLGLMLVYFLVPGRARWGVLLAGSYAFIAVSSPHTAVYLLLATAAAFLVGFGVVALLYNRVQLLRATSDKSSKRSLKRIGARRSVFVGLLKKEFFLIYRTPSYAFQYFSVAVIMPRYRAVRRMGTQANGRLHGFDYEPFSDLCL